MRMMNKIFGLLLLSVFFVSCGSDDDPKTEYTLKDAECKITCNLGLASAGGAATSPVVTKSLDEMLASYDYVSPITSGTMSLSSGTSIKIEGLTDDLKLNEFTLIINGISKSLGTIDNTKDELYDDTTLSYFQQVFNSMISNQKLEVKASFKPSADLAKSDQVKINLAFKGTFKYYK